MGTVWVPLHLPAAVSHAPAVQEHCNWRICTNTNLTSSSLCRHI